MIWYKFGVGSNFNNLPVNSIDHMNKRYNLESGYTNRDGVWVPTPQFKYVGLFFEERAIIRTDQNLHGFIDRDGNIVIQPQFRRACEFSNGLAGVQVQNGSWGFVDRDGQMVIAPQFKLVFSFHSDGWALAESYDGKWGAIDRNGQFIEGRVKNINKL